jgi:hypothetical protein
MMLLALPNKSLIWDLGKASKINDLFCHVNQINDF